MFRPLWIFPGLCASLLFSGCAYIHFGRLPAGTRDNAAAQESMDLRTEKKILQQELAIARKENDALRNSLNDRQSAPSISEPAGKLAAAYREISALRATVTQLNTELLAQKEARAQMEKKLAMMQSQMIQEAQRPVPATQIMALSSLRERSASSVAEIDLARLRNAGLLGASETPTAVLKSKTREAANTTDQGLTRR